MKRYSQPSKYIPYSRADIKKASDQKLFTVMSLFAGGGGSSTGYRLAGGDVLVANEFVDEAVLTYRANYPETKILSGDIKDLKGEDFLEAANLKPGELDILDGSPPCSAFSIANRSSKEKFNRTKKYSEDKIVENIEDLFLEYIRIANVIQPKIIVAENVPGITEQNSAVRSKLLNFIHGFESIKPGYKMIYQIMDASKYGVAQSRRRTFFVGVRSDLGFQEHELHSLIYPQPTTPNGVSIHSAIDHIVSDPCELTMLRVAIETGFQKKFAETMEFNPQRVLKPKALPGKTKATCFNLKRPAPNLPCPTLTQMGQQVAASGVLHYAENRKLTIPELCAIMSLPMDFQLTGTFDQKAERIGRMVPPKLMAALAANIYRNILND